VFWRESPLALLFPTKKFKCETFLSLFALTFTLPSLAITVLNMATLSTIIQEHEQEFASLELSETIHELQTQLQVALEVASGLKEENCVLKTSLEDCRASNASQQRRNEEWRNAWKKEVDTVAKREKKLLHDENAWDVKLAEKRNQLDELESQLVKKKDEIRSTHESNAQGDNNHSQSIKIEHLEKEIDKWRKQFFEAQKMSEEIQQMESKYLREAEMAKVLRKEIASLQQLYAECLEKDNSNLQAKYQEKARELMLKVDEMDLVAEKLREETKEMRKSRDEAIAKCDELKAQHHVENGVSSVSTSNSAACLISFAPVLFHCTTYLSYFALFITRLLTRITSLSENATRLCQARSNERHSATANPDCGERRKRECGCNKGA